MSERRCYQPDCTRSAISSHLLQRNGLLREIAVDGHVYELSDENLFRVWPSGDAPRRPYYFRRRGVGSTFTFLGFCQKHDHQLFREIESRESPIASPRASLLFSYRGFLNELNKQENNVLWYEKILRDNELVSHLPSMEVESFRINDERMRFGVAMGQRIKQAFELDLGIGDGPVFNGQNLAFKFIDFTMKRISVCTSAVFSITGIVDRDTARQIISGATPDSDVPMYFINILPTPSSTTTVLIGYRGPAFAEVLPDVANLTSDTERRSFISDVLLKWVETWAISPRWYHGYLKRHEERILEEVRRLLPFSAKHEPPRVSLFALEPPP